MAGIMTTISFPSADCPLAPQEAKDRKNQTDGRKHGLVSQQYMDTKGII